MATTQLPPEEIARRGREIYENKIRALVEPHGKGQFVVIDIDSGDYEMDSDHVIAARRARAKHPVSLFYSMRVGSPFFARLGSGIAGKAE